MTENDLSKEDVRRLVYSYKDTGVTDELYSFGKMLLSETEERAKQIDSKSTAVLGWATAIVVFLFTQLTKASGVLNLSFGLAGFFGLLAVGCAYAALRPRHEWLWPSDRDWFEQTAFGSADELKRFHARLFVMTNNIRFTASSFHFIE